MSPRGRRIAIALGSVVVAAAGVLWWLALRPVATDSSLTNGPGWSLVSRVSTSARPGTLVAHDEAGGLRQVSFVTVGTRGCDPPSIRGVVQAGDRVVVRLRWPNRSCPDARRGERFTLDFTGTPPRTVTFELVEGCVRWDVSRPAAPIRRPAPKVDVDGNCPL